MIKKIIPFSRVDCSGNEIKYLKQVIKSGWLTSASKNIEFENNFKRVVGSKYAIAVNSCTSALHLALESIGIRPGDKVLVPSMTFTSTVEAVNYLGADPVFLDVEYDTLNISPSIVSSALKKYKQIKAIIVVHFAGHPAEMLNEEKKGILDICRSNNIKVIEDAAHAFPASIKNRMIGNIGDITCFSFYANKTISTGEGGMLTTNNNSYAKRIRVMRSHGIDRNIWDRYTSNKNKWEYDVVASGYKYNLPDTSAAIGVAQLERVEEMRFKRQKCAEYYLNKLNKIKSIDLPVINVPFEDHSWHLFVIKINNFSKINRNKFIDIMLKKGVSLSVHYKPLHKMTYYSKRYKLLEKNLSNTNKIWNGNVSLPIYSLLSKKEIKYITECISQIL